MRKQELDSIVVGWNGSAPSRSAAEWALGHRGECDRVTLLQVGDDTGEDRGDGRDEPARARADAGLRFAVKALRGRHPGVAIERDFAFGSPQGQLLSRTNPTTLVVVGAPAAAESTVQHGSSFATYLAARAYGPVAIVPAGSEYRTGPVVVGVDGTPASRAAVVRAAQQAQDDGERLVVVHAWPLRYGATTDDPHWTDDDVDHHRILESAVREVTLAHPHLVVEAMAVRDEPFLAIADACADASVLVLGKHGSWRVSSVLLGTIAHSAVLTLPVPTVVVSPDPPDMSTGSDTSRREVSRILL